MNRSGRLFEELMQVPHVGGRSFDVLVAVDRDDEYPHGPAMGHMDERDKYEPTEYGGSILVSMDERDQDGPREYGGPIYLTPQEIRFVASMLLRAADVLDPDGADAPEHVTDPTWTHYEWPYSWHPAIGDRVLRMDGSMEEGTVVGIVSSEDERCTVAWDSGTVTDHAANDPVVERVFQARITPITPSS